MTHPRPRRCTRAALPALALPALVLASALLTACGEAQRGPSPASGTADTLRVMNEIAEQYVHLALAVGEHDSGYVDAYYGPDIWRQEVHQQLPDLQTIRARAGEQLARLEQLSLSGAGGRDGDAEDELIRLRHSYLHKQLASLAARVDLLTGALKLNFDQESEALYDAVAPHHDEPYFLDLQAELNRLLPGDGPLVDRLDAFRNRFVIPPDRLDAVFTAAIAACRERTSRYLQLPEGENFTVAYVTGKPWSAYNWYQGGYQSLIEVNTDLPVFIDRAVDLACHEGYPGHHVYNLLLEQHLVRQRGWVEFSIYPLFSPQSLIAEGTANYGIEMAFPGAERVAFEREVLFPLAGLDAANADEYYQVLDVLRRLSYAGNEAARRYLDGEADAATTIAWLGTYALTPPARAAQRVSFYDQYRTYVINYNFGEDLVRAYIERQGATPEQRWQAFGQLLSSPRLPSDLR